MRSSRWLPIAGWCVATATSIVLSSFALSPVLNAARAESGALPDLDQLPADQVAVTTTSSPPPPPAAPERPEPTAEPDETETGDPEPTRTSRKPSSKPATTKPPVTTPPAATTTPPTTTQNGWTVTTGDDGVRTYVRTFRCDGGQAVIRMTDRGTVALVTATPADGYSVQKQGSDTNLAIYFTSTPRSFVIHAQWHNGEPLVEVTEIGA